MLPSSGWAEMQYTFFEYGYKPRGVLENDYSPEPHWLYTPSDAPRFLPDVPVDALQFDVVFSRTEPA